jgi:serine/threonine protein kinase
VLLPIGTTFDRYVIEARLGQGGIAEVFRARDTRLDRSVAIKVPRAVKAEGAHRMLREARAAAALDHPNVRAPRSARPLSPAEIEGDARRDGDGERDGARVPAVHVGLRLAVWPQNANDAVSLRMVGVRRVLFE